MYNERAVGAWPSTGFLAIAFAVSLGRRFSARVSVYGFGACVPCNKYFDCDGSNSSECLAGDASTRSQCGLRNIDQERYT